MTVCHCSSLTGPVTGRSPVGQVRFGSVSIFYFSNCDSHQLALVSKWFDFADADLSPKYLLFYLPSLLPLSLLLIDEMKMKNENTETKRVSTDVKKKMDESKVAKRLLEEQIKKIIGSSKMVKWPEEEDKKDYPLLQEAIREQQELVDLDIKNESSTDTECENDFRIKMEHNDDNAKNVDNLKKDNLKDNERTDDPVTNFNIARPSTSTGVVSKFQIVKHKSSRGRHPGPKVVAPVPLRILTKNRQCAVSGCKKVCKGKKSLNGHLLSAHQFKEYRCLMRRCHDQESELNAHLRQVHGSLSLWTCICSKKVKSYAELKHHYWLAHELGTFACSKEDCTFKSTSTRALVEAHHRSHDEFSCPVADCGKVYSQKAKLTRHLRKHQCFRCTWPGCTRTSTYRSAVISHIRTVHFKLPASKKKQAEADIKDDRDARVYLAKV